MCENLFQVSNLGQEVAELGRVMKRLALLIESMMTSPQTANIYNPLRSQGHSTQSITPEDQVMRWINQLPSRLVQTGLPPGGPAAITAQDLCPSVQFPQSDMNKSSTLKSRSQSLTTLHQTPPAHSTGTLQRSHEPGTGHTPLGS